MFYTFRTVLMAAVFSSLVLSPRSGQAAEPMRDFVMSCSYGVLAGTLVGAAGLAFTDRPGDNLNLVARGASIGLYAGILLGLFVISGDSAGDDAAAIEARKPNSHFHAMLLPVLTVERGLEGAQLELSLARF